MFRQFDGSGIENDDTKSAEVGLPQNLSRADHRVMAIGFNRVLRFTQPKQANPVFNLCPQSLMRANATKNLPQPYDFRRKLQYFLCRQIRPDAL
jgi:hypothetical protein